MSELQSTDNPTLEKLIREVDYVKMGENYIPSKFAIKFINFSSVGLSILCTSLINHHLQGLCQ